MLLPLHLAWKDETGAAVYNGGDYGTGAWTVKELPNGVLSPGSYSDLQTVILQNTVQERRLETATQDGQTPSGAPEKFVNLKLYLEADPATTEVLMSDWPAADAGVELSFDGGVSWTRLSRSCGYAADPSTWVLLPGAAVCPDAVDGELNPFPPYNRAVVRTRIKTPKTGTYFGVLTFSIVPDFDVI